jgi:two-component system cell cycle sensor histidine kinase/response regulator CckA
VLTISTERLRPGPRDDGIEAVQLTVADNGLGMPPEIQARAFEPFFTTKEVGRGSGLGLATVYGIVEQAGGRIELESSPGQGTTFRIRLPGAGKEQAPGTATTTARGGHGSETILLVEDEAPVRAIARRVLSAAGYQVLEAADAVQARRLAGEHAGRIDLLITDVIMPGTRGPELAEELVGREPGLRVLFISGYSPDSVIQRESARGRGFIQKPFTPQSFRDKVRQVLEGGSGATAPAPPR